MKIRILIAFFLTSVSFLNLKAQEKGLVVGLYSGLCVSEATGSRIHESSSNIIRPNVGFNISYPVLKWLKLTSGIRFETKGSKTYIPLLDSNANVIDSLDADYQYNYLTFPLFFKFENGDKFKYNVGVGVYYSILVSQSYQIQPYGSHTFEKVKQIEDYSKSDYGFSYGVGCSYRFYNKLSIALNFQRDIGLTNILINPNPVLGFEEVKLKSYSIFLVINYSFTSKK